MKRFVSWLLRFERRFMFFFLLLSLMLYRNFFQTKSLFVKESVTSRNLAFTRVLVYTAQGAEVVDDLVLFLLEHSRSEVPKVSVRALKTLKYILNCSQTGNRSVYCL